VRPLTLISSHKTAAAADEADAGNDLRRNAGGIKDNKILGEHVRKTVLRDQQEKGSRCAGNRVSTQARALVAYLPLHTDGSGKQER
jgi:hypothetical protein